MKKLIAKLRHFLKGETPKKIEKGIVTAAAHTIEDQMLVHDMAADKGGAIIVSQKISGVLLESSLERRDNVKNTLCATAEKMNMEPTGHEFAEKLESVQKKNPDFFNLFFDSVKNVSNEEVRQYWEAILKGELEQPGSMPMLVVDILRKLDKDVVVLFDKAFQFHCGTWIFTDVEKQFPISVNEIQKLNEYGLMVPITYGHAIEISVKENGWGDFDHCGIRILVERVAGKGNPAIPSLRFTKSGFLIAKTINKKRLPNREYLTEIAKFVGSGKAGKSPSPSSKPTKFRLLIAVKSGDHIPIDPTRSGGGVRFELGDDGNTRTVRL